MKRSSIKLSWTVWAVCFASVLAGAGLGAPPPLATDGPKPFFTGCVEKQGADPNITRGSWIERPARNQITSPFYDVPFALHVPLEVRHEAGIVRITYAATVTWDDPPEPWVRFRVGGAVDSGLYRNDGKSLPADSVLYDSSASAESSTYWHKLVWDVDSPVPTWTHARKNDDRPSNREDLLHLEPEADRHVPFAPGRQRWSLVLAPAQAGWYTLWFAFDLGTEWPPKEPKRETVTGHLHVDVLVSRGQRGVRDDEFAYLFGRGKRPAEMPDDELFRASTVDIPLKLRRDGWVFDRAEIRPLENSVKQEHVLFANSSDTDTEVQSSTKVGGATVALQLNSSTWNGEVRGKDRRGRPYELIYKENDTWTISLPTAIPDYGFAMMTASGGKEKWYTKQSDEFRNQADAAYSPNWMPERFVDLDGKHESSSLYAGIAAQTMDERDRANAAGRRQYFLSEYGPDALQWWVEDFRKGGLWNGPQKGEGPFQFAVRGSPTPADLWHRKLIAEDAGTYPLMTYRVGPWLVIGHYRRLKDVEARATPAGPTDTGPVKMVEELDPFWKWYPAFSRLLREQLRKIEQAKAEAGLIGLHLEQALRSNVILLELITDPDNQPSDAYFNRILKSEQTLAQQIREHRQRLDALTSETRTVYNQILGKLEEGFDKFGEQHPELLLWEREYRDQRDRLPYSLASAAGDIPALRKAAEEAEYAGGALSGLIKADLLRRTGDPVGALYALRKAATVDPEDAEVKQALTEAECAFLKTAIEKSQGAIKEARSAFYGYLMERGFGSADNPHGEYHWYSLLFHPLSQLDNESAWVIFTTGAIGSFTGIFGKPEAEADLLNVTETRMTTAFLGLHTMLRLRLRGHSLVEIRAMTSEQLRAWLPLKNVNGQPFTDQEIHLLGVAVREALKLPDVQALVAAGRIEFGLKESYWNAQDVGNTWVEYCGDITSIPNLTLLLFPFAKVGKLPTAIRWGAEELQAVERAAKAGEVISGTEFVARSVGLEWALQTLGKTSSGKALLDLLERSEKYRQSFGKWSRRGWSAGKVVATIALQTLAVHLADEAGGHKAALAMQAVLLFGGDSELLIKLLRGKQVPLATVERLIRTRVIPAAEQEAKLLTGIAEDSQQIRAILDRVHQGKTLSPEELAMLERKFGAKWRQRVPNGSPDHDIPIPLGASAEGIQNGVNNGAIQAVEELAPDVKKEAAAVAESRANAEQLANDLHNAPPEEPLLPAAPEPPLLPAAPPNITRVPLPTKRELTDFGAYPLPPAPQPKTLCAEAEAALHAGNYAGAFEKYRTARYNVQKGWAKETEELPLEFIDLKMALAEELSTLSREKPSPGEMTRRVLTPVTQEEMEELMSRKDLWQRNPKQGAMGRVFAVEDRPLMVKLISKGSGDMLAQAEGEIVHSALAQALGIPAPAVNVRLAYTEEGELIKVFFFMRKADGKQLAEMSAAEIFRYKEELSSHRALAILLGNYDTKIDNYIVSRDGGLIPIDAGQADVTGERCLQNGLDVDSTYIMEGQYGRDHWLSRFYKDEIGARRHDVPKLDLFSAEPAKIFARKNIIAEQSLTYQAAKPTIQAIDNLIKDEPKLRGILQDSFKKIYGTDAEIQRQINRLVELKKTAGQTVDMDEIRRQVIDAIKNKVGEKVNQTVKTLQARHNRLDKVMRGLNDRNAIEIPTPGHTGLRLVPGNVIVLDSVSMIVLRRAA